MPKSPSFTQYLGETWATNMFCNRLAPPDLSLSAVFKPEYSGRNYGAYLGLQIPMCEAFRVHDDNSLQKIQSYIFCILFRYATLGHIARKITQFKVLHGQINTVFDFPPAEELNNDFLLSNLRLPHHEISHHHTASISNNRWWPFHVVATPELHVVSLDRGT